MEPCGTYFPPLTFYVIFLCLFSNYDNVVLGLKVSAFLSSHLKKGRKSFSRFSVIVVEEGSQLCKKKNKSIRCVNC